MSSVLYGNTGFAGGNRLNNDIRGLQNQIDSLRQENKFLVSSIQSVTPAIVETYEKLRAEAAAKVAAAAAEAARQEAMRTQQTSFARR
jgi:septal ring factor EnvC (AmiA/AmiB activator)